MLLAVSVTEPLQATGVLTAAGQLMVVVDKLMPAGAPTVSVVAVCPLLEKLSVLVAEAG